MTAITPIRTAAETALVERFKARKASLPGDAAIAHARSAAIATLEKSGLPHRRVEAWKYTDLRNLMREAPETRRPDRAEVEQAERAPTWLGTVPAPSSEGTAAILFVDGVLFGSFAAPSGVAIESLSDALSNGHPLLPLVGSTVQAFGNEAVALNTAFMSEGLVIDVAPGARVARPIHLVFRDTGAQPFSTYPRVLVAVGEGASLTLIETHEGRRGVAYQANSVVEIRVDDGARCEHVRVNLAGDAALALSTTGAWLGKDATFSSFGLTVGAAASRHQLFVTCAGEDARLTLGGATLLRGSQHGDTTLVVDHAVPGGESRELFKTVVDDEATGIFQGKIIVRRDAQKTDGRMMSAALLLCEGAAMNNKPELEIFADDVLCAHGATCGALDDDLLFYLMARGLPRHEAEALMVEAFVGEAVELVTDETVRGHLLGIVQAWLAARAI